MAGVLKNLSRCCKYALIGACCLVLAQGQVNIPPFQSFAQRVDHSANDNATFMQRYQLDATHFKAGGPILFHQSEESNISTIVGHVFSDYAPKLNAIVATLEHRYFGESFPYNLTGSSEITSHLKGSSLLQQVRRGHY
jgi:hypothetical protein